MTATRTPERPAEPFPSLPLEPARHQQVRALLVREAGAPRRHPAVRWAVPVGVGALAAAVAAAVAVGGGQLLGADGRGAPAVVQDQVDCSLGTVQGDLTDVPDEWRLLAPDPAPMAVEATWVNLTPSGCGARPTARARQVLVAAGADGTVTAALTSWTAAEPPAAPDDGSAAVSGSEPVEVRGTTGRVRTGGTAYGLEQVWWTEGGEQRSVSVSGLDRATLLRLVELLDPDGTLPAAAVPAGMTALTWDEPPAPQAYEPIWYATYGLPASQEADGSGSAADVDVARTTQPWQTQLSLGGAASASRLVDVDGRPGVLFDNGTGRLWLQYSLGDGVQVMVQGGPGADDATASLDFASTFVPVGADDPRLVEPDWSGATTTDSP